LSPNCRIISQVPGLVHSTFEPIECMGLSQLPGWPISNLRNHQVIHEKFRLSEQIDTASHCETSPAFGEVQPLARERRNLHL
jgi:hypothetical protein